MNQSHHGILAAGNFIVDQVKIIDAYPQEDMLATILTQSQSNGGGPYNVLKNLAALQAGFPLAACGVIGTDPHGQWIHDDCLKHNIDVTQLHRSNEYATSYTDAMTVQSTGRRTFFHQRGANAIFHQRHCDLNNTNARILHLGYLMLLDHMDQFAADGRTHAAHLLDAATRAGLETSVDMVSTEHPQFREIAISSMRYTDHLMINEIEASRILHRAIAADDATALQQAARDLIDLGVRRTVTIHTVHGAVAINHKREQCIQASLKIPHGFSKGATGAGDAFAAGLLYGLNENLTLSECLHIATCTAACSLSHATPSQGILPLAECLQLATEFGYVSFS